MAKDTKAKGELAKALETELIALLEGGHAHATFGDAVKDFPVELRGKVPKGLPYSAWQIVEHLRLAQRDMLEFSDNADESYKEKKWPDAYWPKEAEPPNAKAWQKTIDAIHADRKAFVKLLNDADKAALVKPFAWGSGQNLLKEALQLADHNAYHIGELIVVRRLLGAWKK
jgi:DinB superfamily